MLLECQNCGAPLDVAGGATRTRCAYCGRQTEVKRARTVALETPAGWEPPATWTPPLASRLPQRAMQYRPGAVIRRVLWSLAFSAVALVAVGGFIASRVLGEVSRMTDPTLISDPGHARAALDRAMGAIAAAASATQLATESARHSLGVAREPLVCSGHDSVTLTGDVFALPDGSPIVATDDCTLRLVACTVSGDTAVVARGNAQVTVEGGTFTGTGPAFLLSGNAKLDVASAVLVGENTLDLSDAATARVRGSTITGRSVAVRTRGAARADTLGATVQGKVVKVRALRR